MQSPFQIMIGLSRVTFLRFKTAKTSTKTMQKAFRSLSNHYRPECGGDKKSSLACGPLLTCPTDAHTMYYANAVQLSGGIIFFLCVVGNVCQRVTVAQIDR